MERDSPAIQAQYSVWKHAHTHLFPDVQELAHLEMSVQRKS